MVTVLAGAPNAEKACESFRAAAMLADMWRRAAELLRIGVLLVACYTLLAGGLGVPAAFAEASAAAETAEEQARRAQDLHRTVMSPFCPGRTLEGCPSPNAKRWRDDIREWVAQGLSSEEIKQRLEQRTDHDLTGAPSTALDAVLPFIVTIAAMVLLVLLLRKLVRPTAGSEERKAREPATDRRVLDARLDEELRNMDD